MTERKMTLKGFLHKSTTKAANSATAFLAAHREFLQTGELALFTTPILLRVDSKDLMPTPALEEIKAVVLAHHLAEVATIYNSKTGEVVQEKNDEGKLVDLKQSFDDSVRAEGWTDRRLFDNPGCFGVVESTKLFRQDGTAFAATILRDDSIARILKRPKAPVMKAQKKSGGKLSFGVKVKPSHASFSRG
jgi:hypothetical protein